MQHIEAQEAFTVSQPELDAKLALEGLVWAAQVTGTQPSEVAGAFGDAEPGPPVMTRSVLLGALMCSDRFQPVAEFLDRGGFDRMRLQIDPDQPEAPGRPVLRLIMGGAEDEPQEAGRVEDEPIEPEAADVSADVEPAAAEDLASPGAVPELPPEDSALLEPWLRGTSQAELAQQQGCSPQNISYQLTRIVRRVLSDPRHVALRERIEARYALVARPMPSITPPVSTTRAPRTRSSGTASTRTPRQRRQAIPSPPTEAPRELSLKDVFWNFKITTAFASLTPVQQGIVRAHVDGRPIEQIWKGDPSVVEQAIGMFEQFKRGERPRPIPGSHTTIRPVLRSSTPWTSPQTGDRLVANTAATSADTNVYAHSGTDDKKAVTARHRSTREWMSSARCADPKAVKGPKKSITLQVFFPEKVADQKRGAKFCGACAVKNECLADALDNNLDFGVFGGMTERQRRAITVLTSELDVNWSKKLGPGTSTDAVIKELIQEGAQLLYALSIEAATALSEGKSIATLAKELGVSQDRLTRRLYVLPYVPNVPPTVADWMEKLPRSKRLWIDRVDVGAIKEAVDGGMTPGTAARRWRLSKAVVDRALYIHEALTDN